MKKSVAATIKDQYVKNGPVATADLSGKTVVVVGANTGLGFEATKHFASMNPGKLILACRSEERGKAAVDKLKSETSYDRAELWLIDLGKLSSVIAFADRFEEERLDILVANAALNPSAGYKTTSDGWEESIQVNNIATSLLCLLLAPRLAETGRTYGTKPRIVIVSSDLHYTVNIKERVFEAESPFRVLSSPEYCTSKHIKSSDRYSETKLLNVFFAQSLSDLLRHTPVIVNTLNPGYCYSELRRTYSGFKAVYDSLLEKALARTTEDGSRFIVYAAVGGAGDTGKLRGAYLNLNTPTEPSDHVIGEAGKRRQDKLWVDLVAELSKIDRRIPSIVQQFSV
ncbi:hypothetical protein D9611_000443 [Ephemerocybe angulata]|uniref:Short-chain dehydrogenase n=1 Tax=Ephemerocybe angulata TaxID=980116 RepID=A0A8H5F793_9AGAR|nr:hypothetical protein D9611_000443 [Tulosesus angulatus]